MKERLKYIWENIWIVPIVFLVLFGIFLVTKDELSKFFNPDPTIFKTEQTDYYQIDIPEKWNVYDGVDKQVKVYSDLSANSFIDGIITVYKYNYVAPEDLSDYCSKDAEQIKALVKAKVTVSNLESRYDKSAKRCLTSFKAEIDTTADTMLKTQYHNYFTYVRGEDLLTFELISPEKELTADLEAIVDSISITTPETK